MPGDIFGGDDWEGVLLASSGLRLEMLLDTLQGTGPPTTRMSVVLRARNTSLFSPPIHFISIY